jgi:hypothetical protein
MACTKYVLQRRHLIGSLPYPILSTANDSMVVLRNATSFCIRLPLIGPLQYFIWLMANNRMISCAMLYMDTSSSISNAVRSVVSLARYRAAFDQWLTVVLMQRPTLSSYLSNYQLLDDY